MIFETLKFSGNPDFEYQNRFGKFYKRKIGDLTWNLVDDKGQAVLAKSFAKKPLLYQYTTTAKLSIALATIAGGYFLYKYLK